MEEWLNIGNQVQPNYDGCFYEFVVIVLSWMGSVIGLVNLNITSIQKKTFTTVYNSHDPSHVELISAACSNFGRMVSLMGTSFGFVSQLVCCHGGTVEPEVMIDSKSVLNNPAGRKGPILEFELPGSGEKSVDFSNAEKLGLDLRRPTGGETAIKVDKVAKGSRAEELGVQPGWTLMRINDFTVKRVHAGVVFEQLRYAMRRSLSLHDEQGSDNN